MTSPRRIEAKLKIPKIVELRVQGYTFAQIALELGYKDASGPWRAMSRYVDKKQWEDEQKRR